MKKKLSTQFFNDLKHAYIFKDGHYFHLDGVDLSSETSEVTSILLDLTKRETLNQSSSLVNYLIKSFRKDMNLLQRTHRYAGFAVLKSLDIPSVLIEMGYLSNKKDSKLL